MPSTCLIRAKDISRRFCLLATGSSWTMEIELDFFLVWRIWKFVLQMVILGVELGTKRGRLHHILAQALAWTGGLSEFEQIKCLKFLSSPSYPIDYFSSTSHLYFWRHERCQSWRRSQTSPLLNVTSTAAWKAESRAAWVHCINTSWHFIQGVSCWLCSCNSGNCFQSVCGVWDWLQGYGCCILIFWGGWFGSSFHCSFNFRLSTRKWRGTARCCHPFLWCLLALQHVMLLWSRFLLLPSFDTNRRILWLWFIST